TAVERSRESLLGAVRKGVPENLVGERTGAIGARRGRLVEQVDERLRQAVGDRLAVSRHEGGVVDEASAALGPKLGYPRDDAAAEAVSHQHDRIRLGVDGVEHRADVLVMGDAAAVSSTVMAGEGGRDRREPGVAEMLPDVRPALAVVPRAVDQDEGR